MKTRYILAGGKDREFAGYWSDLAQAIKADQPPSVLCCFFAEPREVWEEKFTRIKPFFLDAFGREIYIELAQPNKFVDQLASASLVYLHGGDNRVLKGYLSVYPNLGRLFQGKTIVGSSAGACFLSTYCWPCDSRSVEKGLGLTPLNVIPHFGSDYGDDDSRGPIDWEMAKKELKQAIGKKEVTPLPEGKFVVFVDEDH